MGLTSEVKLEPIKLEEKMILENLVALYLHDLSEYADDLKINKEGRFEYEGLELYFKREELKPFFIYLRDEIVGFMFVHSGRFVPEGIDYSIHEIFIMRGYRRKGIADQAVKKLFQEHKGTYKIEQLVTNQTAINFWKKLYKTQGIEFNNQIEIIDDLECYFQIFKV